MLPLILGAAGVLFLVSKKGAAAPAGSVSPLPYSPAQPSQLYPWRPISPPRVDNKSQPWYNGPSVSKMSPSPGGIAEAASALQAGASVIHSLSDIWGQLSPVPTDDYDSNLMMSDSMENVDYLEAESDWEEPEFDDYWSEE